MFEDCFIYYFNFIELVCVIQIHIHQSNNPNNAKNINNKNDLYNKYCDEKIW